MFVLRCPLLQLDAVEAVLVVNAMRR